MLQGGFITRCAHNNNCCLKSDNMHYIFIPVTGIAVGDHGVPDVACAVPL